MKYLKKFEQLSDYQQYMTGGGVDRPNVSYIVEDGTCYYEPMIPSDEIWYTTTDGNIVEPYTSFIKDVDGNSVTIESNTYKDGKGVIKFSKPISTLDGNNDYDNGEGAFHMKTTLKTVLLPDTITTLNAAFLYCLSLLSINIPLECKTIGNQAFNYTQITTIYIPSKVESIGEQIFLKYNISGETVSPSAIDSVKVSSANKYYHSNGNCIIETSSHKLVAVANNPTIPAEVAEIGAFALAYCRGIKDFVIGDNVKTIGKNAFLYSDISTLSINQTVPPSLATQQMFGCDAEGNEISLTIYVSSESVEVYKAADGWKDYADRIQAIA